MSEAGVSLEMSKGSAPLTPVLSANWGDPRAWKLVNYERRGGYQGLRTALAMSPDEVISLVKDAGLRGRGGAGFPAGLKWSFIPKDNPNPTYLVVNCDESEPGTCKDMPLLMASPHTLVEGAIIASYAVHAKMAFLYVRGEVLHIIRRLQQAVAEAYAAGYLGTDILGSGYDLDIMVHAGAGAYICGEETALLDSLEGRRGQPRLRPPFPAVAGLYASPTVVNNAETISSVPAIVAHGKDWFQAMGTEKSAGFTLYSLSGHVARPGQYEAPLGITLHQLLDISGGMRAGHRLKFFTPGGSSTPMFSAAEIDVPLDYESVAGAGSIPGHQGPAVLRRDHLGGAHRDPLDRVLQARVLRQVHPLPGGHLVAGPDAAQDRGRRGGARRRRQDARRQRPDRRQILLHPGRRRRRMHPRRGEELPGRVRGRLPRRPGMAAAALRAQHGLRPRGLPRRGRGLLR
jgi:NADH-quinone oxidoreductase subunit F